MAEACSVTHHNKIRPLSLSHRQQTLTLQPNYLLQLGDGTGSVQIGLYHEGTDGLLLDYAEILTDNRLVYCSVGYELDDDQYSQIICT